MQISAVPASAQRGSPQGSVKGSPLAARWTGQSHEAHGYPADVATLDASLPHTIHDLKAYLTDNLGAETMAAAGSGAPFTIAVGEGSEVAGRLASEGWKLGEAVAKGAGFHRVNHAVTPDGKDGFLVWRVNGEDRRTHLQSLLQLAGVPSSKVTTTGASRSFKADYLRTFQGLGKPDLVVYGMGKTAAGAMLKTHPVRNAPILFDLFRRRGAPPVSDSASGRDTDGLKMEVMRLKNGQTVWFLPPLYGDLSRDVLDALLEHGVKKLHFVGTAGALNPNYRVGDVVTVGQQLNAAGQLEKVQLPAVPADRPDATYMRIDTPNRETLQWAEDASRQGVDLIEVELGYWLEVLKKHPDVRFTAQAVISDVLVGEHAQDMTKWSSWDSVAAHDEIVGAVESALGVSQKEFKVRSYDSVPLATREGQSPPAPPEDGGGCWNLTGT